MLDSNQLDGKVALVTGAAGEIGAATVKLMIARGARIVAVDRDKEALQSAVRRMATAEASEDAIRNSLTALHPLGRLGTAEDIAAIVFLASDESSFVTGAERVIDGGYSAR